MRNDADRLNLSDRYCENGRTDHGVVPPRALLGSRGIKLGGSFPQNTQEKNPCNCELDSVMFLDRAATQLEINQQYRRMVSTRRW